MRRRRESLSDRQVVVLGSAVAVALAGLVRRAARRPPPVPVPPVAVPAAAPALPVPDLGALALERIAAEGDIPRAVGEAYRTARRAFNATQDSADDDAGLEELRVRAQILWSCATLAEASSPSAAKKLARDTRGLLRVLDEHAAVLVLVRAAAEQSAANGPLHGATAHVTDRAARLRRRIDAAGKAVFAAKPARVVGRLAADH